MSIAPSQCFWPGFRVGPFTWGLVFFAWSLTLPVAATPTLEQEIRTSFEVGEAVCRRDDAGAVFQ